MRLAFSRGFLSFCPLSNDTGKHGPKPQQETTEPFNRFVSCSLKTTACGFRGVSSGWEIGNPGNDADADAEAAFGVCTFCLAGDTHVPTYYMYSSMSFMRNLLHTCLRIGDLSCWRNVRKVSCVIGPCSGLLCGRFVRTRSTLNINWRKKSNSNVNITICTPWNDWFQ
jgi:hypothetical protein